MGEPTPDRSLSPNAVLVRHDGAVAASVDWVGERRELLHPHDVDLLEAVAVAPDTAGVARLLAARPGRPELPAKLRTVVSSPPGDLAVALGPAGVFVLPAGPAHIDSGASRVDVTHLSGSDRLVRHVLGTRGDQDEPWRPGELDERVERLRRLGLLVEPASVRTWLAALPGTPVCQVFGFLRGTPIDRYYLQRFVDGLRAELAPFGRVLDVGGSRLNRFAFRLTGVTRYDVLDLEDGPMVTMVGDALDPHVAPEGGYDTVLLFNVLEHVSEPGRVLDNVRRWLRPGGVVLVAVPYAQRLHRIPRDYWRFTPDSLALLFADFADVEVTSFGNLRAAMANLAGVAAEELPDGELDETAPDYPVVLCVKARA